MQALLSSGARARASFGKRGGEPQLASLAG